MKNQFKLDISQLKNIANAFTEQLRRGLNTDSAMLKALPTFITRLPQGTETGEFLVVDLGGSNLRVGQVKLEGEGRFSLIRDKWILDEKVKKGTGRELFDFIASRIDHFLRNSLSPSSGLLKLLDGGIPGELGFTFSYPVRQRNLQHGELIQWNKALECHDVIGQDVVICLEEALKRRGLGNIKVKALLNDTVGTMLAHAYVDPDTRIGVILGTGTNAAYSEEISNIRKLSISSDENGLNKEKMVINVEWGAFGEDSQLLPLTDIDRAIDRETNNPGKQLFEKMVSGMYLGEITRLLVEKELEGGIFLQPFALDTADLSHLQESDNLEKIDKDHFELIKELGHLVVQRSAQLVAAALVGIYQAIGSPRHRTIVAFDGAVYEHYPKFPEILAQAAREICPDHCMEFQMGKDESIIGAAIVLATIKE